APPPELRPDLRDPQRTVPVVVDRRRDRRAHPGQVEVVVPGREAQDLAADRVLVHLVGRSPDANPGGPPGNHAARRGIRAVPAPRGAPELRSPGDGPGPRARATLPRRRGVPPRCRAFRGPTVAHSGPRGYR